MAGLTMSCGRRDGWPYLLLWAPNGWPHGGFPFLWAPLAGRTFSCGRLTAGRTEVPIPKYCPLCGRPMAGPSFSCGCLTASRMEDPIRINF